MQYQTYKFIELRSETVVIMRRARCAKPVTSNVLETIRRTVTPKKLSLLISELIMEYGIADAESSLLRDIKKALKGL